jgi:hypothetical protein
MKEPTEALFAAQLGIDQAEQNNRQAHARLLEIVRLVAQEYPAFTTDDVMIKSIVLDGPRDDFEPRVLGAVMRRAAKDGVVKATAAYQASSFRSCHARPKRVWQSLIL